ncbi:methyltransferase domain-containing protein [Desulfonatronovibrio magnus]|uniref:methyltransferase domain-containing protein n=1 Tax=Desulfonatronovibrio magnus TaxID=698827 RepID=UPI0005EB8694|nr:methyltransferase domain-containing protein [Desulfonatronovibrio magnus]
MSWIPPVIAAWEKLSSTSKTLTWMYSRPYRKVIENEIHLARITEEDVVLNVGCGAVPFTALYIATITGARVYAMDIDKKAVKLAEKCVSKTDLSHKVDVLHGDGATGFQEDFSVAVIALQAAPKNNILEAMISSGQDVRLVFRLPSPAYRDHYDNLITDHYIQAATLQPMTTFDRSVLLESSEGTIQPPHVRPGHSPVMDRPVSSRPLIAAEI